MFHLNFDKLLESAFLELTDWVQNTACFLFPQLFDNYETSEEGAEHAYDALKTFLTQVRGNRDLNFFLLQFSPIVAVVYVH